MSRVSGHNAAGVCLAKRRCNVTYALLRDGTFYQIPTTVLTAEPAALAS